MPTRWITDQLGDDGTVSSLVPWCFESYARLLHPAYKTDGSVERAVTWTEIASYNGATIHPKCQFPNIAKVESVDEGPLQSGPWTDPPSVGSLPPSLAAILIEHLSRGSSKSEECGFGVWTGWSDIDCVIPETAELELSSRTLAIAFGPIRLGAESVVRFRHQSAYCWWPADRSWYVATDIDLVSTYIGGSAQVIAGLISDRRVEVIPARPDDSIRYTADDINPAPC